MLLMGSLNSMTIMNNYLIRYNTKHGNGDLVWRIFENGVEHQVKAFNIFVPACSEKSIESGVVKWNVGCKGVMHIVDDVAYIKAPDNSSEAYNIDQLWYQAIK